MSTKKRQLDKLQVGTFLLFLNSGGGARGVKHNDKLTHSKVPISDFQDFKKLFLPQTYQFSDNCLTKSYGAKKFCTYCTAF